MPNFKQPGMMFKHEKGHSDDEKRIYVNNSNKVGSYVNEAEFEDKFEKKPNDPSTFPQLSVQDYSTVKQDSKGKYVVRLKDE